MIKKDHDEKGVAGEGYKMREVHDEIMRKDHDKKGASEKEAGREQNRKTREEDDEK
jgi:hypothetical protein